MIRKQDAWQVLGNREGDLSAFGPEYTITQSYFETQVLPSITDDDFVIFFYSEADPNLCILSYSSSAECFLISGRFIRPSYTN